MKHEHYWNYPQVVWGDESGEYLARYCRCGVIQAAKAGTWRSVPKSTPDIRDFCLAALADLPNTSKKEN